MLGEVVGFSSLGNPSAVYSVARMSIDASTSSTEAVLCTKLEGQRYVEYRESIVYVAVLVGSTKRSIIKTYTSLVVGSRIPSSGAALGESGHCSAVTPY